MSQKPLTPPAIKALTIVKDRPFITPTEFSYFMWPDSDMHTKTSNQGRGACTGKAAWMCAGGYLGKLLHRGLLQVRYVGDSPRYYLSREGEKALAAATQEEEA